MMQVNNAFSMDPRGKNCQTLRCHVWSSTRSNDGAWDFVAAPKNNGEAVGIDGEANVFHDL